MTDRPAHGADSVATGTPTDDTAELRDSLPEDLNASEFVGPYQFPDNSRRRMPGYLYAATAAICAISYFATRSSTPILINKGFLLAAAILAFMALMCFGSGWRMQIDEKEALVVAGQAVGFPVGHASAQQVWRGLRSRPTWRVLCYSFESPPKQRGFVLVDAVDGSVKERFTEDNPETDWAE